jgi:hypothetical protein
MSDNNFLRTISDVSKIITPIDSTIRFPEILDILIEKYSGAIETFCQLIRECDSSEELLRQIRQPERDADERIALLKMYRRCVSPVLDTETTKKIKKISTATLIEAYGLTFKPIGKLKQQFEVLSPEFRFALAALVGEYDTRGQSGYELTGLFFDWFATHFEGIYLIEGPRGRSTPLIKVPFHAILSFAERPITKLPRLALPAMIPHAVAHNLTIAQAATPIKSIRQELSIKRRPLKSR